MRVLVVFAILLTFSLVTARRSNKRPNIIFILTDDQDVVLGSMWAMNKTRSIFREGAEFVNAFVTSPICCPSRSSILTGMYSHNHNTLTNNVNCSSQAWRVGPERNSYARYLADAGYLTAHFGKYLNEYDGSYIPAGWHHWVGLVRNSRFYNYTLRYNNYLRRHKNIYGKDYFTDVITNQSLAYFRRAKSRNPNRPVLMVISHSAPHGPEDGAPQYQAAYENITAPRTPNWNVRSLDKHWILRVTPKMDQQKIAFSDLLYRKRLQTLLSVDDSIQRVYNMLKETGTLDNTYIFLSSDHGYHLGQFGLVKGKSMPYESDIRVPFYIRGPFVPKNARIQQMVLNIDLAPTFLDIAGVKPPRSMDGVSVMKLFTRRLRSPNAQPRVRRKITMRWRDTFLVSRGKVRRFVSKARTSKKSPKTNKAEFLNRLCAEERYWSPCGPGQQWHCVKVKGRWRLKKCKKIEPTTVPTTPKVEMCTCYRPRLPWKPAQQPLDDDSMVERHMRRLRKRSLQSERRALKQHRYYKEIARAIKQANRRKKSRAKLPAKSQQENEDEEEGDLDKKLERINAKIAGIKFRLEALRGRKKKLIRIKEEKKTESYLKQKFEEFPCPCPTVQTPPPPTSSTTSSIKKRPKRSNKPSRMRQRLRSGVISEQAVRKRLNRRNMRRNGLRTSGGGRKKKTKSSRRSKCAVPGLSCFHQTNYHWKTPPLWTGGEFCFCPSSSNNTYWCLRTINQYQNFLYCEYITEFLEYFDLNTDPYQLYNIVDRLSPSTLFDLHSQLERLKSCKGAHQCTEFLGKHRQMSQQNPLNATEKTLSTTAIPVTEANRQSTQQLSTGFTDQPSRETTEGTTEETAEIPSTKPAELTTKPSKVNETMNESQTTEFPTTKSVVVVETTPKPTEVFTKQVNASSVERKELEPAVREELGKIPSISKKKLERRRRRKQKKAERNKEIEPSESAGVESGKTSKEKKGGKKKSKNSQKKRQNRQKNKDNRPNDDAGLSPLP